jgi:DNA-binding LacI/PurR family transcriptional regulator
MNNISGLKQRELARKLGISQMSISRVVNNRPGVSAALRKKILAKMQACGYVPDRMAAGLRGKPSGIIGLVIPDVSSSFFPDITMAIENCAAELGKRVILAHSYESYAREAAEIRMLRQFRVDGYIIAPAGGQKETGIYRELQGLGIPFVFIDRYKTRIKCDRITSDIEGGACELGRYLANKGYRQWAYARGPHGITSSDEHEKGLRRSLKESRGRKIELRTITAGFSEEDGYRAASALLSGKRPDLIVAVNDLVAIGIIRYLKSRNIAVPRDMAVAGFSNLAFMDMLAVPLTTVAEQTREIGQKAFEFLWRRLQKSNAPPQNLRIKTRLVVRASAC